MTVNQSRFERSQFVAAVRAAIQKDRAVLNVEQILGDAVIQLASSAAERGDTEVLFEDESVSIWHCRFDPAEHVPPHDHQTSALIGVYQGSELNHFYKRENGAFARVSTKQITQGDVFVIQPDQIHSVQSPDGKPSYALHVYLAELTVIDRSLFDWASGEPMPMNEANYERLLRRRC